MAAGERVHVVSAGLLRRRDRGLLVHRAPTRRCYPDCWDLPGGHVADGETPDATLRRELREELDVRVVVAGPAFADVRGDDFREYIWVIDEWDGEPVNADITEHDQLAWFSDDEMMLLQLADPRLPSLLAPVLR